MPRTSDSKPRQARAQAAPQPPAAAVSSPADKARRRGPPRARSEATRPHVEPLCVRPDVAAQLIGCGRTKVKALMTSGELESVKIGAMRLIKYNSLKRLIDNASS